MDHTGDDIASAANTIAAGQLRAFIERIERLEEEKSAIGGDIKEVYAELKG
ncbi:GapR family DNA-binding domain-containing protein, partial [Brucella anthropi]|uniref:GapR family DNA-binding domain-containing protein n=1 Tax=Brucella anthropi TaxID=529 RepID=UPI001F472062